MATGKGPEHSPTSAAARPHLAVDADEEDTLARVDPQAAEAASLGPAEGQEGVRNGASSAQGPPPRSLDCIPAACLATHLSTILACRTAGVEGRQALRGGAGSCSRGGLRAEGRRRCCRAPFPAHLAPPDPPSKRPVQEAAQALGRRPCCLLRSLALVAKPGAFRLTGIADRQCTSFHLF